jgi:peptidoglycan biosynthesis protein MviN/MurJ (putative lipid II flippase)
MFVALASMMLRAALIIWWSNLFGAPGIALAYAVGVVTEGGALWWLAQKQG